jgi:hypothetical protein
MGNYGNPRARTACARLTEQADSTSRNICGVSISREMKIAGPLRMGSQDVAWATDGPRSRDERLRQLRTGGGSARASGVGFAGMIAIIDPAVCGLLAQGTT